MKKQLLLIAFMTTSVFSAHASNKDGKIKSYQNYAVKTAAVSAVFTAGFFLRTISARVALNRLITNAKANNTNRSYFWSRSEVINLIKKRDMSQRSAEVTGTFALTTAIFANLDLTKKMLNLKQHS